jgi:predicted RNA-binding Zn ribbon-like protein
MVEPALALANTRVERRDLLGSPRDLNTWLEAAAPSIGPPSPGSELRLADFRELREAIRALCAARAAGRPVPREAVEVVNAVSAAVPTRRSLDDADAARPVAIEVADGGSRTAELLATIARSAIDVVGGPDGDRLHVCPAPGCGRFFVATRPGRRWCGGACGNRVRVARHYASRRAGTSRSTVPDNDRT